MHTGPSQLDQALAAEGNKSPKASQAGLPAASTPGAHLGHSKYEVAQVLLNRASGVMTEWRGFLQWSSSRSHPFALHLIAVARPLPEGALLQQGSLCQKFGLC